MKCVGIVAEYNPFHNGHLYQIQEIRKEFGEDTAVVAVMSGNYTQRAEASFFDKVNRAECAVRSGVNLVLELPFPFSSSSAEFFATAGVSILNALGVVDVLSFGSESGDSSLLSLAADRLSSDAFKTARDAQIQSHPTLGHAAITQKAYRELWGDDLTFTPNNILALEYLMAMKRTKSSMSPHTIARLGDYHDESLHGNLASASAIRKAATEDAFSFCEAVPPATKQTMERIARDGHLGASLERLYPAIVAKFMLNAVDPSTVQDGADGLYTRLRRIALQTNSLKSLIDETETKKYTRARIRRVIVHTLFGVTSSDLRVAPLYTQMLAADAIGLDLLKRIKKQTAFPILTKPSDADRLPEDARAQKALSDLADRFYCLTTPTARAPREALTYTPYIHGK